MAASSTSTKSTATQVSPATFAGTKAPAAPKARAPKSESNTPAIAMGSGPVALVRNQVGKPGAGQNAGLSRIVRERLALAQANQKEAQRKGREKQAAAAKLKEPFSKLIVGSPAHTFAEMAIDLFPTMEPAKGPDGKKTGPGPVAMAVAAALEKIGDEFILKHAAAVEVGKKRVYAAFAESYNNSEKPAIVVSTPEV